MVEGLERLLHLRKCVVKNEQSFLDVLLAGDERWGDTHGVAIQPAFADEKPALASGFKQMGFV